MTYSSSCVSVLFQTGITTPKDNALIELLHQFATEPIYDQLRTKEQLGYTVWTSVRRSRETQGFQILVQGDKHPAYVESRIDKFLNDLEILLRNMTQEEFLQTRRSLLNQKASQIKYFSSINAVLWSEISSQQYNFKRETIEIQELEKINLADFISFFERCIGIGPYLMKQRRLTVYVVSSEAGKIGNLSVYTEPRVCCVEMML
jgi:insulysin